MNSNNTNTKKQSKKSMIVGPKEEIQWLKRYIANCPNLAPNSNAIRVSLTALDEELKRLERDEKLRQKFAAGGGVGLGVGGSGSGVGTGTVPNCSNSNSSSNSSSNSNGNGNGNDDVETDEDDMVKVSAVQDDECGHGHGKGRGRGQTRMNGGRAEEEFDAGVEQEWQEVKIKVKPCRSSSSSGSKLNPNFNRNHSSSSSSSQDCINGPLNMNANTTNRTSTDAHANANAVDMVVDVDVDVDDAIISTEAGAEEEEAGESVLGGTLAQAAMTDMSNANVTVTSPLAALALVLHSVLRSDLLAFKCTGVPDDDNCFKADANASTNTSTSNANTASDIVNKPKKKKKTMGFAAPVRELSRGVFLPKKWDQFASKYYSGNHRVLLRYRKNGMAATILRVEQVVNGLDTNMTDDNDHGGVQDDASSGTMVRVNFGVAGGEPSEMVFPLHQHINLDGLHAALSLDASGVGVKPSLHYKALAALVTRFCHVNDLGAVKDGNDVSGADLVAVQYSCPSSSSMVQNSQLRHGSSQNMDTGMTGIDSGDGTRRPPTIQDDLLGINSHRRPMNFPGGDFSDDLLPSGLPAPGFANPISGRGLGGTTGNLMGPNHPAFHPQLYNDDDGYGNNNGDFITPGGLGMQPRFDPYYPPGVGGRGPGIGRGRGGRGRGRGGRFSGGDPNPDHQRPPNNFGSNMFM